jgi:hypothetical protein
VHASHCLQSGQQLRGRSGSHSGPSRGTVLELQRCCHPNRIPVPVCQQQNCSVHMPKCIYQSESLDMAMQPGQPPSTSAPLHPYCLPQACAAVVPAASSRVLLRPAAAVAEKMAGGSSASQFSQPAGKGLGFYTGEDGYLYCDNMRVDDIRHQVGGPAGGTAGAAACLCCLGSTCFWVLLHHVSYPAEQAVKATAVLLRVGRLQLSFELGGCRLSCTSHLDTGCSHKIVAEATPFSAEPMISCVCAVSDLTDDAVFLRPYCLCPRSGP